MFRMSPGDFQRARQPHQKAQRRAEILAVAREMLDEGDLEALTLNALARRVGLAKSNIYRYFESREAILLHVFREDVCDWVDELATKLSRMRTQARVARMAQVLASCTASRPRLCQLISAVGAVLERNVSVETALEFKLATVKEVGRLVAAMAEAVPELTADQHGELVRLFGPLVAGLWPSANPSEVMAEVMQHPAMQAYHHHDFEEALERGALLFAQGLVAEP